MQDRIRNGYLEKTGGKQRYTNDCYKYYLEKIGIHVVAAYNLRLKYFFSKYKNPIVGHLLTDITRIISNLQ